MDRKQFVEGFVGFGGGRYQCPGKWFALMEMHLYVVMVIKMFDLELKSPMPEPVSLSSVNSSSLTSQPFAFLVTIESSAFDWHSTTCHQLQSTICSQILTFFFFFF